MAAALASAGAYSGDARQAAASARMAGGQVVTEASPAPAAVGLAQSGMETLPDEGGSTAHGAGDGRASDEPADELRGRHSREDILVEGEVGPPPEDPLANVNEQTFEVVQAVDKALVEPVTHGYMAVFPKPVRQGIHNVITNLDEPIAALSFLLQFKPLEALKTLGRFAINSTIGLAGLIDVAKNKPFNRPHIRNGFGHTLAYYGIGPGPFLYLPIVGSTTLRDLIGQLAQIPVLPLAVGKPFNRPYYVVPKFLLTGIDERAQDDERIQKIRAESSNPYADYRSYYLRKRQAELDVIKGLREDSEVPVFDDEPEVEDYIEPAGQGAMFDSSSLKAEVALIGPADYLPALAR
jgi:phospholipid-binding lipoprotein MlaA